jgi:2'-5' RNA ligase
VSRLFVAVTLPAEIEAHLDDYVDVARSATDALRWVPSSRWHITVEFLGECGRHEADRQLARWTDRARRCTPLEVAVAGAGTFPQSWRARVLWAGVTVDPQAWRRLAGAEQQPHVTLARTREATDLAGVVASLSNYCGPSWNATEVVIMESHLRASGERGPRYEPLEYLPLGGPDDDWPDTAIL